MSDIKRLFLAIKIIPEPELLAFMLRLKSKLKYENIRWTNSDNLHLTLKFFGETPVEKIDEIISQVAIVTQVQNSFNLKVENLGVFGSSYHPKVIWSGFEKSDELSNLERKINQQLEGIGYKNDRQNFVPHLTLGRIKQLKDKKLFQQVLSEDKTGQFQESVIDKIILFESVLNPSGAVHEVIQEFPFL